MSDLCETCRKPKSDDSPFCSNIIHQIYPFVVLNDHIWGEGNWIYCDKESCLHPGWDGRIKGSYHHKEYHT